jgi:uncharacterized protein (DUF58 family)
MLYNHGMTFTSRIRINSPLLLVLFTLLLIIQILQPSRIWTFLFVGLGLTLLVNYIWARSLARYLRLTREMRFGLAQVGDRLEERFTLENAGWLAGLWVEIDDDSTMPDYLVSSVTGIGGMASYQWRIQGLCTRRGVYRLGPTHLRTGDPLGIFTVIQEYSASTDLVVTPPIIALPKIEVAPGGRSGEGRPRANAPDRTVSASGVREYVPGESLRLIHWRTTARKGEPYVQIFDGTPASDWWVILDLDQACQIGQGADSTEEDAVILAASLVDRGLRLKRAVGLVVNSQRLVWMPPQEGDGQKWEILRTLATVSPGGRKLGELLGSLGSSIGKRSSAVIITSNVGGDWLKNLIPLIWRGVTPTLLLLDPISFGGTPESSANTSFLTEQLTSQGIARWVITRDLFQQPEARPGKFGWWEWKITPQGHAIAVKKPSETAWRRLA